jgi:hypothetical protein
MAVMVFVPVAKRQLPLRDRCLWFLGENERNGPRDDTSAGNAADAEMSVPFHGDGRSTPAPVLASVPISDS